MGNRQREPCPCHIPVSVSTEKLAVTTNEDANHNEAQHLHEFLEVKRVDFRSPSGTQARSDALERGHDCDGAVFVRARHCATTIPTQEALDQCLILWRLNIQLDQIRYGCDLVIHGELVIKLFREQTCLLVQELLEGWVKLGKQLLCLGEPRQAFLPQRR